MASPYGLERAPYAYHSDDGNTYYLGTTQDNGNAQSATPLPNVGSTPRYPAGYVARHVYGVSASFQRTKLPVFDPTNGLWTGSTTSFSKNGITFSVYGKIGEKRTLRGV